MLLDLVPLLLLFAAILGWRIQRRGAADLRPRLIEAAVWLAAGVVVGSELLGLVGQFRPSAVTLVWLALGVGGLAYVFWLLRRTPNLRGQLRARFGSRHNATTEPAWHPVEIAVVVLVLVATGLVAFASPATNYDAMTYQLPRMLHWLHQGSLAHFPTDNVRQIAYGPGASYWQAQLWVLSTDHAAANLPQWLALLGCATALSLIVDGLGLHRAIGLAVTFAVTLPMAVAQASSCQTDLQVACWLLAGVALLLGAERDTMGTAALAGVTFGFAVLTKPSAAMFAVPLAVAAWARSLGAAGATHRWRRAALGVLCALAVVAPHFGRNYRWFGTPLGEDRGTIIGTVAPGYAVANLARWLALEIPSASVWNTLAHTLERLGLDPNFEPVTFSDSHFAPTPEYVLRRLWLPDEDYVGYGTSALALLVGLAMSRFRRAPANPTDPAPDQAALRPWLWAAVAGLLLHSVLLRWQVWGNRLLLPGFILLLPLLAARSGLAQHRAARGIVAAGLGTLALLCVLYSINRPVLPLPAAWGFAGAQPIFSGSKAARFYGGYNAQAVPEARQLVDFARQQRWRAVGIEVDENYPEFVLWRALRDAGLDQVELHHVGAQPPPGVAYGAWPPRVDGYIKLRRP